MSTINTAHNEINDSCCAKVVVAIDKMNSQTKILRPTGVLNALTSDDNKQGFKLNLSPNKDRPTADSFRKVYTSDLAPICNQDTTADSACALPTFVNSDVLTSKRFVEHTIDLSIKRDITLDVNDFKKFCDTPDEFIANQLMRMRSSVWQEINRKVIQRVIAYMGQYYGQVTPDNSLSLPKQINLFNDPVLGYSGFGLIKDEYAKLGYLENPIIVGGSLVANALNANANGNGFNQAGYAPTFLPNGYVDYELDVAFSDGFNHLLTWGPGSLQLVTVNEVSDDMIRLSEKNRQERFRVKSPFGDGFMWDYYFDKSPNGCQYVMKWQLWFDVICPVPYDGDCAKKPTLHFLTGCTPNACPDSSVI